MFGWFVRLVSRLFFFTGYVGLNSSFPDPLPAEEERRCLEAMAQGDELAREKLIEHNLRLVAHIAKKYASPKRDSDDLISIGTVGLIKAVSTFNASKSKTLAAYAARCIENEILMSLRAVRKQNGEGYLMEPIGTDDDGNEISVCGILGADAGDVR
ncbi:MAG: sigma-70 family RNA polymerase sigma factor, partial [Eubacteriales bacterium]|nr:sigma-70 family RNA polymerase sigma factor [Eubacteriales bacterium]